MFSSLQRKVYGKLNPNICQRSVTSSSIQHWDSVRPRTHPLEGAQHSFLSQANTVAVIGAPMTYGQPHLGTDDGPDMLRSSGLISKLQDLKLTVEETGNLHFDAPNAKDPVIKPEHGKAKQSFAVGNGLKKLFNAVVEKHNEGKFCLVLGGDHTIGGGSLAGALKARPNTGCIWVDAHADINTPMVSPSGNIHGMPISFLVDGLVDHSTVPGFEWMAKVPRLNPSKQLVYVGLRDIDSGERKLIRDLGIKAFTMQDVDRYGIGRTMEMAIEHLNKDERRPIHMSYDIDAVDPVVAPSTGTTVRGGLSWREAMYIAESVAETGSLCSLDMVEVNPLLVPGQGAAITIEMALELIASALGNKIL